MFVLGTAGHIDHGKSVLVHALTGIDPDRLHEEKERGMTIDLGFAWLKLPSGKEVGIVDVPGHERFIKNMLAGVGGIDLALLVIAANEGVMPQTREHLAILELLAIEKCIIVITKKDLVDNELLILVKLEIEELLINTIFARSPILAVSAINGEGISQLIATLDNLLNTSASRKDIKRPRLSIDRVFSIVGSGTVVTGTLIDGSFTIGEEVEIVPPCLKSRIRGLQMHKGRIEIARPGSRIAANLVGVANSQLQRGDVVSKPGCLTPTRFLSTKLRLLSNLHHKLSHSTTVNFHTGSTEAVAKVLLLEGESLDPGATSWVQFLLDRPIAVVNGDHFIIRSPVSTLGGGRIADVYAKRLRRSRKAILEGLKIKDEGNSEDIILSLLEIKQPLQQSTLLNQSALDSTNATATIETLIHKEKLVKIEHDKSCLLVTKSGWKQLVNKAITIVQNYHHKYPTRAGILKAELDNKLGEYSSAIISKLIKEKIILEKGLVVHLPSHQIKLNSEQENKIKAFLVSLEKNPFSPPSNLVPEHELLSILIKKNEVVKVSSDVVFSIKAYNEMLDRIIQHLQINDKITLAQVRDMFRTSRKYAQAFLEHLDEKKITRRLGDERVLY